MNSTCFHSLRNVRICIIVWNRIQYLINKFNDRVGLFLRHHTRRSHSFLACKNWTRSCISVNTSKRRKKPIILRHAGNWRSTYIGIRYFIILAFKLHIPAIVARERLTFVVHTTQRLHICPRSDTKSCKQMTENSTFITSICAYFFDKCVTCARSCGDKESINKKSNW